jgi:hypothetical protein
MIEGASLGSLLLKLSDFKDALAETEDEQRYTLFMTKSNRFVRSAVYYCLDCTSAFYQSVVSVLTRPHFSGCANQRTRLYSPRFPSVEHNVYD